MDSKNVYLVQTDTTVGFLSSDDKKLSVIKCRPLDKKTLQVVDSFKTLCTQTRIPKQHRKRVRNSKKTTFIYPNQKAYRVIDNNHFHSSFIKKFSVMYSTSANITQKQFDLEFAVQNANICLYDHHGYHETTPSSIIKLFKKGYKKLRSD